MSLLQKRHTRSDLKEETPDTKDGVLAALEDDIRYVWTLVTPRDTIGFIPNQVGKRLLQLKMK